jgi:tetratricopeptide (TPR) repeat protein
MQLIDRWKIALALSAVLLTAIARADEVDDTACSLARMELAPLQVIEPCSAVLRRSDLSAEQRSAALFVRGRAYHRTGRIDLAGADYDAALQLAPANDEILVSRANVAFRDGEKRLGVRLLMKALEINPRNARALRAVGMVYAGSGPIDQAIKYLSEALDADPAEPYALLARSQIYSGSQQYQLALRDADRLVAIEPGIINRAGYLDETGRMQDFHVIALANRSEILAAVGKLDAAERDLDAAVAYKWCTCTLMARAEFLRDRKRDDEALRDIDAAIVLDQENVHAFYLRGLTLMGLRRSHEAFDSFNRALQIAPRYDYALRMRARLYREFGQTEEAVRDYEAAILSSPRMIVETIPALQHAGYWRSPEIPTAMTPELRDAIRACMLDETCN